MPKTVNAYSKNGPPIGDDEPDHAAASQQIKRIVSASGLAPVHTTAPASIFAAGLAAKPNRTYSPAQPMDPDAVVIRSGVPVAPSLRGGSPGFNRALIVLQRMKSGDMVEVAHRHANSLAAQAKTAGIKIAKRKLSEETSGVWRLA